MTCENQLQVDLQNPAHPFAECAIAGLWVLLKTVVPNLGKTVSCQAGLCRDSFFPHRRYVVVHAETLLRVEDQRRRFDPSAVAVLFGFQRRVDMCGRPVIGTAGMDYRLLGEVAPVNLGALLGVVVTLGGRHGSGRQAIINPRRATGFLNHSLRGRKEGPKNRGTALCQQKRRRKKKWPSPRFPHLFKRHTNGG